MNTLERVAIIGLVGAVGYLLGRSFGDKPLYADSTVNSDHHMIAVAAPYQAGVSLLYVLDTETKQLAIYEARGGSKSSARLSFLAARRVDLDLRLEGYHDDSEYSFSDLAGQFRKNGWTDIRPGVPSGAGSADKSDSKTDKGRSPPPRSRTAPIRTPRRKGASRSRKVATTRFPKRGSLCNLPPPRLSREIANAIPTIPPFPTDANVAEEYISFEDALRRLELQDAQLKRLISENEIKAYRDGERMKLKREDVDRLRNRLVGTEAEAAQTEELVFEDDEAGEEPGMETVPLTEAETMVEKTAPKRPARRARARPRASRARCRRAQARRRHCRRSSRRAAESPSKCPRPTQEAKGRSSRQ